MKLPHHSQPVRLVAGGLFLVEPGGRFEVAEAHVDAPVLDGGAEHRDRASLVEFGGQARQELGACCVVTTMVPDEFRPRLRLGGLDEGDHLVGEESDLLVVVGGGDLRPAMRQQVGLDVALEGVLSGDGHDSLRNLRGGCGDVELARDGGRDEGLLVFLQKRDSRDERRHTRIDSCKLILTLRREISLLGDRNERDWQRHDLGRAGRCQVGSL